MSDQEVAHLLEAAATRPLDNFTSRNTGIVEDVKPATIETLKRAGRQRRLIYLVLLDTGLRWSELKAVRVCDVVLDTQDGACPHIVLWADRTKAKRAGQQPLSMSVEEVAQLFK